MLRRDLLSFPVVLAGISPLAVVRGSSFDVRGIPDPDLTDPQVYSVYVVAVMDMVQRGFSETTAALESGSLSGTIEQQVQINSVYVIADAALAVLIGIEPPPSSQESHDLYVKALSRLVAAGKNTRIGMADGDPAAYDRAGSNLERFGELVQRAADAAPSDTSSSGPSADTQAPSDPGAHIITGFGMDVSGQIYLSAGRYLATVSMDVVDDYETFICWMRGPGDYRQLVFNEFIEGPQDWSAEGIVDLEVGGPYFVEVSGASRLWRVSFAPY